MTQDISKAVAQALALVMTGQRADQGEIELAKQIYAASISRGRAENPRDPAERIRTIAASIDMSVAQLCRLAAASVLKRGPHERR